MKVYVERLKGDGINSCKRCGATVIEGSSDPALFDTQDDGREITLCQVCGAIQQDVRKRPKK